MTSLIQTNFKKAVVMIMLALGQVKFSNAQSGHLKYAEIPDDKIPRTITDPKSQMKFVLDSSHINIGAIDKAGKSLWKTDPWKDNNLPEYRYRRPIIARFYLDSSKRTNFSYAITISYNSTQTGYLDILTGKFKFMAQD